MLGMVINWVTLAYGLFATAVGPVLDHDEVQIAVGGEVVVLALVSLLWSGHRRSLGWGLVVTGAAAPVAMYSTATLYWDDTTLFTSEAFWTAMAIGAVIGAPLVILGVLVLRGTDVPRGPDPWWLPVVRGVIVGGMWAVVLAFRAGDWSDGVVLVYVGGGLALLGLVVALPRRFAVQRRGVGLFLLFIGLAGGAVVVVSAAAVGSHMSTDEAALGLIPAVIVAAIGGLIVALPSRPSKPSPQLPRNDGDERVEGAAAGGPPIP
ncbi:hypothetical protein ACFPIJ_47475 [Dactylosporangium cerinum]|uniref:Uncharacterized protein n=1 Tax=Dactylosporangium cerinum TaxID=1434730 RepID=A0ABV9W9Q5_9ACTN